MEKLFVSVLAFWNTVTNTEEEKGATATEYALLVGLIALAIAVAVALFGTNLSSFFNTLAGKVTNWSSGTN